MTDDASTDEPSGEPPQNPARSLLVVAAVLLVIGVPAALAWLYQERFLLTAAEYAWVSSQRAPLAGNGGDAAAAEPVLTLRRSRCFGECPAYELDVFASGRVEFRGEAFVCETAPPPAQVDPRSVRRLVDGMRAAGFANMPDYTRQDATDHHTVTVTLRDRGVVRTVEHYRGDAQAPRLLAWIEDRIDEVAGTSAWTGTWRDGQRRCEPRAVRAEPVGGSAGG